MRRRRLKPPPQKTASAYRQLWRVVDGAIAEALRAHPDYLAPHGAKHDNARRSIAKRVVGAVLGYAEQSAKRRSGGRPAPDSGDGDCLDPAAGGSLHAASEPS